MNTPFFFLDAQYHVAPDAGFDALMNDAELLQDCGACIVQLVAAEPEALATMYMESVLFGANFLIRMASGITEAARRRAPKPEQASLPAGTRDALHQALYALEGRWPGVHDAECQRDHQAIRAVREVLALMAVPESISPEKS